MTQLLKTTPRLVGKAPAFAAAFFTVMALCAPTTAEAQTERQLVRVDTVLVEGNSTRVQSQSIVAVFAIQVGQEVSYRDVQRGIKALLNTGLFKDIVVRALGTDPVQLVVTVEELPTVRRVDITGLEHGTSAREVRDTTGLRPGFPYNPQRILDAKAFIREELADDGIPFAEITDRLVEIDSDRNEIDVVIDVVEGQRVTIAEMDFTGNEVFTDEELRGAMSVKPEGFWWFRSGSFDEAEFDLDLELSLPTFYAARGYLDFEVVTDTIVVDPMTGKSRVVIEVDEGEEYRLGTFAVNGASRFTTEELEAFFAEEEGGILRSLGFGGSGDVRSAEGQVFNSESFEEAILTVEELYRNEGYLYARINPVTQKVPGSDGAAPTVNVAWEISEGSPALVNRVSIGGNEYTYEWVIRNQIFVLPGDVYSQDRVLRSYQNISGLGFFEAPMPFPDIEPTENGDVDITFNVVEKQTGSINFGTSVGGGVGLSGFVGYQQPNLFGQAKAGSLRWDFGTYLNSFEASYTDPALFQSLVSGSLSLFNSRDRFFQFSSGRRRRVGATTRFGFPWPASRVTRMFAGYGISRTKYELFNNQDDTSLFGRPPGVQSQATFGITRQTLDHPLFPTAGSRQNVNIEANGGLLGGDGQFTKILADATWWVPIGSSSGGEEGAAPGGGLRTALGLTIKGGALFGNADAFPFDRFWMGGVQFGQNLRGYDETSITPLGYFAERAGGVTDIDRLGDAFFTITAEYALRMSDQIGISLFFDAGNVWREPGEFDPTVLYRGAGIGLSLVTPFGPIGLDYAYGFDKTTPGWQLHFKMGPGF
ncbi:MAG: outer membrane protein assembly factor BamA [Gemmatimonadales bacterium]|nr:outer membrane protein assembly factor BamA [Gemmatimonadales bacterium]MBT3958179.1 outer membrane protein assembly factor BamA [Gemmatimonadales bacterium]MBT5046116.1 outer membrane protein assembly factor BamA [Gemmatimonadales bacterium]MBT6695657.1 outer membrane protein assembly factor BamA [Gemmatimonadales bacterium]MBT6889109.1 outer membrane protein assembly factor BamA [Gemmatimonadales bacterium]